MTERWCRYAAKSLDLADIGGETTRPHIRAEHSEAEAEAQAINLECCAPEGERLENTAISDPSAGSALDVLHLPRASSGSELTDETCHFRTHAPQQDERSCTAIRSLVGAVKSVGGTSRPSAFATIRSTKAELGRLLDRKIGGLRPQQNLVD